MSFDQLRDAFDRTAALAEQARRFIASRIQLIAERKTMAPIIEGPCWVVHLVPIAGIANRHSIDLRDVYSRTFTEFLGQNWNGGSRAFNFDGLLIHPGGRSEEGYYAYTHIFRTGAMEAAQLGGGIREVAPGETKSIVWSLDMSKFFHRSIGMMLGALRNRGFAGPAVLSVAILNVQGFELGIGDMFHRFSRATADRPHLIPQEIWLDDLESADVDVVVRPLLDTLWQAFGSERCLDFDDKTGAFAPRRD